MRKFIALVAAVCILCVMLSACATRRNVVQSGGDTTAAGVNGNPQNVPVGTSQSGSEASDQPDGSGTDETAADTSGSVDSYTLEDIGGWWKHVGGSVFDYVPFVDGFFIDAENGTWTEYSQNGIRGGTYTCYADDDGIHLDYGELGVTILTFDGVSLLNGMGIIEYITGDPVVEVKPSAFDGRWYLLGDKDEDFIEINGESIEFVGEDGLLGTYTSENVTTTLDSGTAVDEMRLKASFGLEYVVADTGDVLYDPENRKAYIREEKIDTPEGEDFIKKYDLICHDWKAEGEGMPTIVFEYYENKFYLVNEVTRGGETQTLREVGGTWGIHEYELSIYYSDGHNEITPYDPATIQLSYYSHMMINKVTK